ncbi:hypothetical protein Bca101_019860 [Brassica carinata]
MITLRDEIFPQYSGNDQCCIRAHIEFGFILLKRNIIGSLLPFLPRVLLIVRVKMISWCHTSKKMISLCLCKEKVNTFDIL